MKKLSGLLSGVLAVFFYAVENAIIQTKLSSFSSARITTYFYIGAVAVTLCIAPFALIFKDQFDVDLTPVPLKVFGIIVICILVEVVADFFYFRAYNKGLSVAMVTTILSCLPVIAIIVESLINITMPSARQILGCLMVPIAVYLVNGK